jgi:predicted phage-related endonuclease
MDRNPGPACTGSVAGMERNTHPYMLANIDREIVGVPGVQVLECKTAGEFGTRLWKDGVPEYVQPRVQRKSPHKAGFRMHG